MYVCFFGFSFFPRDSQVLETVHKVMCLGNLLGIAMVKEKLKESELGKTQMEL